MLTFIHSFIQSSLSARYFNTNVGVFHICFLTKLQRGLYTHINLNLLIIIFFPLFHFRIFFPNFFIQC